MKFRPCIDIHNGAVKQIIGKSLSDENSSANENFVSQKDAAYYARLYEKDRLTGGHMILLNKAGTKEYEKDAALAAAALKAYPGGLQIGGGITAENASRFFPWRLPRYCDLLYISGWPAFNRQADRLIRSCRQKTSRP